MYAVLSYKKALIIEIFVHSSTKEVGKGTSKQIISYNYVFVL